MAAAASATPLQSVIPRTTTAAPEATGQENPARDKEELRWAPMMNLRCELTVDLPLPGFRVGDFVRLRPGSVVGTQWRVTHDVPLRVNGSLIAWAELEGSENRLGVRLTELP